MRRVVLKVIALLMLASVAWSATAQDELGGNTSGDPIASGIHEAMYVRAGGIDQWIQIRGDNLANPVLLWLNGGPGSSTMLDTPMFRSWERYFTVVMWDQRGEGKTFERHGDAIADTMSVERMAEDGIEVTRFLLEHLNKQKLVLLGHSWGSILGIHMINAAPQLYSVYVGTGQVTNLPRQLEAAYPSLMTLAGSREDALQELSAIGPPPWPSRAQYDVIERWEGELEPPSVPPSEEDQQTWMQEEETEYPQYMDDGEMFSYRLLGAAMDKEDMPALATAFAMPIVLIQGKADLLTTTSVVRDYFDQMVAPAKHLIEIDNAGHNVIFSNRAPFLVQLLTVVRPLALQHEH